MSSYLAVDLGGTRLRYAVAAASDAGRPSADHLTITRADAPRSLDGFETLLRQALVDAAHAGHSVHDIGIAIPGLADGTVCRWVPNLPYLDGVDLTALVTEIGAPAAHVALGNDAQLALLAEQVSGAAHGMDDVLMLALGTGIGSAVLADGRIVRGHRGAACSFGWYGTGRSTPAVAGAGALEQSASGRALDRAAHTMTPPTDGPGLVAAARSGDSRALAVVEQVADLLGEAISAAVALLAPQRVLLSGGLSQAFDVLSPRLIAATRLSLPAHLSEVDIRVGTHGADAPLLGALAAAARGPDWWTGANS